MVNLMFIGMIFESVIIINCLNSYDSYTSEISRKKTEVDSLFIPYIFIYDHINYFFMVI